MNRFRFIPEELIRIKANRIHEIRVREGRNGEPQSDWEEAKKYLKKHPWEILLWGLNRPFIWLEKSIIEPLDFWADRANIFSFFFKLEGIAIVLIPIAIFCFEGNRQRLQQNFQEDLQQQQQEFQQNLIAAQTQVRHQEAVRDYLSHITTIYLETDQGKELRDNDELKTLLEATTLALFNELSVTEYSLPKKDTNNLLAKVLTSLMLKI